MAKIAIISARYTEQPALENFLGDLFPKGRVHITVSKMLKSM
jgi:hypothetical protein